MREEGGLRQGGVILGRVKDGWGVEGSGGGGA